jgi:glycine C-acetyltransferase
MSYNETTFPKWKEELSSLSAAAMTGLCEKYYTLKNQEYFGAFSFSERIQAANELVDGMKYHHFYFYRRTPEDLSSTRSMINLASNDYLGLTRHPEIISAGCDTMKEHGAASGSVPLLAGTTRLHRMLEQEISLFTGYDAALTYNSGYAANYGVLTALLCENDAAILDMSVHASIADGCCNTNKIFFSHNDPLSLRQALKKAEAYKNKLVVVDGVFSMDGDIAKLDELFEITKNAGAWLMVDESHAIGVIGKNGAGTHSHFKMREKADLITCSTGKALGGIGGFVSGSTALISFLELLSRPFIFSTSLPPNTAAQLLTAFKILREDFSFHKKLWSNVCHFSSRIQDLGFEPTRSATPIIPLVIRDEVKLLQFCRLLHNDGIFVNPIFYPVVQKKKSRIRISVTASLEKVDLDYALEKIASAAYHLSII